MFKTLIKYTDFNGQEREETCYFNLSRTELMKMELSTTAGIEEKIRMLIATNNNKEIMEIYDGLITSSYGIKSEDGTKFIKTKELTESFKSSALYDELFMKLLSDSNFQAEFVNGIINGVNAPEVKEDEAIAKLKELGYDTTRMEQALKESSNKVVPIKNDVVVEENK